jgi:hypothetical protein
MVMPVGAFVAERHALSSIPQQIPILRRLIASMPKPARVFVAELHAPSSMTSSSWANNFNNLVYRHLKSIKSITYAFRSRIAIMLD